MLTETQTIQGELQMQEWNLNRSKVFLGLSVTLFASLAACGKTKDENPIDSSRRESNLNPNSVPNAVLANIELRSASKEKSTLVYIQDGFVVAKDCAQFQLDAAGLEECKSNGKVAYKPMSIDAYRSALFNVIAGDPSASSRIAKLRKAVADLEALKADPSTDPVSLPELDAEIAASKIALKALEESDAKVSKWILELQSELVDVHYNPTISYKSLLSPFQTTPPKVVRVKSNGTRELPYCTWNSTCVNDAATQNECAQKICEASGFKKGVFVSQSNNMCTSSAVSGSVWHWVTDQNEYKLGDYSDESAIEADCMSE